METRQCRSVDGSTVSTLSMSVMDGDIESWVYVPPHTPPHCFSLPPLLTSLFPSPHSSPPYAPPLREWFLCLDWKLGMETKPRLREWRALVLIGRRHRNETCRHQPARALYPTYVLQLLTGTQKFYILHKRRPCLSSQIPNQRTKDTLSSVGYLSCGKGGGVRGEAMEVLSRGQHTGMIPGRGNRGPNLKKQQSLSGTD